MWSILGIELDAYSSYQAACGTRLPTSQGSSMSRLSVIKPEEATGQAQELFATIKKKIGRVPNAYLTIASHSPAALATMLGADGVLAAGELVTADVEAIKLTVSELAGCDYCVASHTIVGKLAGLSADEMRQIRSGLPTGDGQRDALVRFVRKVTTTSGTVPQTDLTELLQAGYSEKQVIEAILAIADITFTNLVNRVNDTTLDFPKAPAVA